MNTQIINPSVIVNSEDYHKLQQFMSKAKTVNEWNLLRDSAKTQFKMGLIRVLDASGYICKILRHYHNK